MSIASIGTGLVLTYASDTDLTAEITNVEISGISKESVDVSHMGSTVWKEFIMTDLADAGQIDITGHYDPNRMKTIPVTNETAAAAWTIDWRDTPKEWGGTGFMVDFAVTAPLEDKVEFTTTIKLTGAITVTTA